MNIFYTGAVIYYIETVQRKDLGKLKLIDGYFDQAIFENRRAKKSVHSGAMELFFGEVYF